MTNRTASPARLTRATSALFAYVSIPAMRASALAKLKYLASFVMPELRGQN
jgi:hypothetical protein